MSGMELEPSHSTVKVTRSIAYYHTVVLLWPMVLMTLFTSQADLGKGYWIPLCEEGGINWNND